MVSPAERLNCNAKGSCKSFLAENPPSCGIWIEFGIKKACLPYIKTWDYVFYVLAAPDCFQGDAKNPSQTEWVVLRFEVAPGAKGEFLSPTAVLGVGTQPYPGPVRCQPGSQGQALPWGSVRRQLQAPELVTQCCRVGWVCRIPLVSQGAASPFAALRRCVHRSQAMCTAGLNGPMHFVTFCYFWSHNS